MIGSSFKRDWRCGRVKSCCDHSAPVTISIQYFRIYGVDNVLFRALILNQQQLEGSKTSAASVLHFDVFSLSTRPISRVLDVASVVPVLWKVTWRMAFCLLFLNIYTIKMVSVA